MAKSAVEGKNSIFKNM